LLSRLRQKRKVRQALRNLSLQKALGRACVQHQKKFEPLSREIPWEDQKKKAREIREKNVRQLSGLIEEFSRQAEKAGARVHRASQPQEALDLILKIAREKKAKLIVKSKSMVSEEIKLNDFLEANGLQVIETDLGEWIIQLAGERPSHITAPALHKTKEEVAELLGRRLGRPVPAAAEEIVRLAREEMRKYFFQADIGISGANFAVAETGTLVIVSNEGNARLVTTLPPVHIALVTTEKFVATIEEATILAKVLTTASAGRRLTSYVSFITGPSSTTDIEKEHITGVHGPGEVHIIILDNGRMALSENEDFHEILYCLKCGGCMLVCPVFQSVGGHVFGGPVYPGGIGTLLTAMTDSLAESAKTLAFCADCKKCENFCPVGIPTGELLIKIKTALGPSTAEKALSSLFRGRAVVELGASLLAKVQRFWQKNGRLRPLPLVWTKGKRLPLIKPQKGNEPVRGNAGKIYFFQGCLVKFFFPEVREGVLKTLRHLGYTVVLPEGQACCGAPSLHLGDEKAVRALAQQNLQSFEKEAPDYILTICPTGHGMLKNHYPKLDSRALRWSDRVVDFTAFMSERGTVLRKGGSAGQETLYYHYPCHYLAEPKPGGSPKELLSSLGFELAVSKEPPSCCGFCGVFSYHNPAISAHLWKNKKREIEESRASVVATDCPGCLFQLRAGLAEQDHPVRSFHTAEILAALIDQEGFQRKSEGQKAGKVPEKQGQINQ